MFAKGSGADDAAGFVDDGPEKWYRKLQWEMVGRAERGRQVRRRREGRRGSGGSTVVGEEEGGKGREERVERVERVGEGS